MFGKRDDQPGARTSGTTPTVTPPPTPVSPGTTASALSAAPAYSSASSYASSSQTELNALLGRGSSFEGKLTFEGTVRIDGRFKGQIVASDTLIVGEEGVVEGEITVGEIISSGSIKGTIRASRAAEFLAPGKVEAELFTASLRIERGVSFDGEIHMKLTGEERGTESPSRSRRSSTSE